MSALHRIASTDRGCGEAQPQRARTPNRFDPFHRTRSSIPSFFHLTFILISLTLPRALANPLSPTVTQGSANFTSQGSHLTIQTSDRAAIQWGSFNLGLGDTTTFLQPSASSIVWNQIGGNAPSQILGNIQANGLVILQNSSGFLVGGQAAITAHGLIMTTAAMPPPDLSSGGPWQFTMPPPTASIINYGQLNLGSGGSAFLIAHNIENHGTISAPGGNIGLAAGQEVLISERPDGRGLSAQVRLPQGSVDNSGRLIADAGTIALHAQVVNQGGLIQANSVRENNGVIELVASDAVNLGASSTIQAKGDTQGPSPGGSISIKSGDVFTDHPTSTIDVSGGTQGGPGGQVEVSATRMNAIHSQINGNAQPGWKKGILTIDPDNITISDDGDDASSGIVNVGDSPGTELTLNPASFASFSQILLQAAKDITLATTWNVPDNSDPTTLTLQAGNNINIYSGAGINAGKNWTLNLFAGADFVTSTSVTHSPNDGEHGIYMDSGSFLQAVDGKINLVAGNDIEVNGGSVFTTGGGAVFANAGGNLSASPGSGSPTPPVFYSSSQVQLQAAGDINVNGNWNFADSDNPAAKVSLQAGNNVEINNNASITAGNNWTVNLVAGATFADDTSVTHSADDGAHSIHLNGSAFVQSADKDINLHAGNDIIVNGGAVRTTSHGNIAATAGGIVNTGNNNSGYSFPSFGNYSVNSGLGGISTVAGGNVSITADGDITSFLPSGSARQQTDAGTGAFGPQGGDVTITSTHGSVYGHYVLGNGKGLISAGANAGSADQLLALSLIQDSWDVEAPNGNIYLQEVRNPNGLFNKQGNVSTPSRHLFDYASDAAVTLDAGNLVQLSGLNLPRNSGEETIPIIYPPSLFITAGSGGVLLGNDVILFPSATGDLNITTRPGSQGPFESTQDGVVHSLSMSDSGKNRYTAVGDFGTSDHKADKPVQYDTPNDNPVELSIDGDVKDLSITMPKVTHLKVGGKMDNTSFSGQNLHAGDETSIEVAGRLWNRVDYTFYDPTDPNGLKIDPGLDPLDPFQVLRNAVVLSGDTLVPLFSSGNPGFVYDPKTKKLGFHNILDADLVNTLENLQVPKLNPDGTQAYDGQVPLTMPATFVDSRIIDYLFANSQDIPADRALGYQISGPGKFKITADSLDLGITQGIISWGPGLNPVFGKLDPIGAEINLTIGKDIDMFSSAIASLAGGDINIHAGGSINVGAQSLLSGSDLTRGIYTSGHSDVNITAHGDIDVNGSRIAAYDGGNINLLSETGDILAGNGADGIVRVTVVDVDAAGNVRTHNVQIAGSGILATTLPTAPPGDIVGNIDIATPQGNIIASEGGIAQLPLNGNVTPGPHVNLTAGTRDPNDPSKIIYAGNIDVTGSGVIGGSVKLDAAGNISGLVVSRQNSDINAAQNFSGTDLSGGTSTVKAGESITGTIIGVTGVSASGVTVDAALLSQNVSVGGAKAESGLANTVAATSAAQSAAQDSTATAKAETIVKDSQSDDDDQKKGGKRPLLSKSTGRVTVVLPKN